MSNIDIIKADLKNAIEVWKVNYLITKGVMPEITISDFGGYIEVSISPTTVPVVLVTEEE
tara:strand:+ start:2345 stop:2524 length:180 start_codon:yes stop_codon:yes gene_type:complete